MRHLTRRDETPRSAGRQGNAGRQPGGVRMTRKKHDGQRQTDLRLVPLMPASPARPHQTSPYAAAIPSRCPAARDTPDPIERFGRTPIVDSSRSSTGRSTNTECGKSTTRRSARRSVPWSARQRVRGLQSGGAYWNKIGRFCSTLI